MENDDPNGYGTAFLEELGFTDIGYAGFGSADPEDCAYTYAKKTLKDGTVLTAVCIQSYALDSETKIKGWKQNFTVNGSSCEGEHASFGMASDRVTDAVAAPEVQPEPEPVPEPEPAPVPESVDTGDPNNPLLWTSLLGGSLAVILIVLYLLKRNRKE